MFNVEGKAGKLKFKNEKLKRGFGSVKLEKS
jgi:hypothetical protein